MITSCSSPSTRRVRRGRSSLTLRILITGGFGYVGGRVAHHLWRAGFDIVLGSRKEQSSPDWLPQAKVLNTHWDDLEELAKISSSVDVVIHAAGMNYKECNSDPVSALAFNGLATARLVEAASRANVKKFIYLSTAHVYANPLVGSITELTCPTNLHPYATSHLAGEYAVLGANERGQIQGVVLRLSNAFGSPMHKKVNCWMLLINDLCKQAVQTRKLQLKTSGLQMRDFIGLNDISKIIEYFTISNLKPDQPRIYNLGSGISKTILEMAKLIEQRCEVVLGYKTELLIENKHKNENNLMLNYQSNNLSTIDVDAIRKFNYSEIDDLLIYCKSNFK